MVIERRSIWAGMIATAMMIAWMWPPGVEALEVSVRGESNVQFEAWSAGTTLVVEGRLFDDVGEALPGRQVGVAVVQRRDIVIEERVYTGFFGRFATAVEIPAGDYGVQVAFDGSDQVRGTSGADTVEVKAAPTQLDVEAPSWVHGDDEEVLIRLQARAGGHGLPTFVSLSGDDGPLVTVDLDGQGEATHDVGPYLEGGDNTLVVEIPASEYRDGVTETATVRRLVDPRVTGSVERVFRRVTRGVEVAVGVEDDHGPLVDAEVQIELVPVGDDSDEEEGDVDSERLSWDTQTGVDGRATAMISDEELNGRRWNVTAQVDPPVGETLVWEGGEVYQEPSGWRSVVVFVAAVVLAGALLWMGRRGALLVWARLRSFWRRRREHRGDGEPDEEPRRPLAAVEEVQLVAEKGRSEEAADDASVVIGLWDEWRDKPVVGASVQSTDPNEERRQFESDADGSVHLELDVEGQWKIRAEAPGYVAARTTLVAPAEGNWLRLVMTPVPLKIRRAYRWMMRRTKGRDDWGRLTPRQIEIALAKVEATGDGAGGEPDSSWRERLEGWEDVEKGERVDTLLRVITAVVEETNFSGRRYETEVWEATRRALDELVERLDSGGGGSHES